MTELSNVILWPTIEVLWQSISLPWYELKKTTNSMSQNNIAMFQK